MMKLGLPRAMFFCGTTEGVLYHVMKLGLPRAVFAQEGKALKLYHVMKLGLPRAKAKAWTTKLMIIPCDEIRAAESLFVSHVV